MRSIIKFSLKNGNFCVINFRAKNVHDGMYTWPYADINAVDPVEDHKNRKLYFYRQYMTDLTERNTKIGAVYPGFKGNVRLWAADRPRTDPPVPWSMDSWTVNVRPMTKWTARSKETN